MGTKERKERERNLRRHHIQESAKKLFLINGFRSTTMEDIAKETELSTGAIYQYFKSKEELYASMNLESLQHTIGQVENIYGNKRLSPEEKILKIKDVLYKIFLNDPTLLRVILHVQIEDTLRTLDGKLLNQLNEAGRKLMNLLASVYQDGVRAGDFSQGDGLARADIMWGTFAGLMMWEEAKKRINPEKDFLKSTLDQAFKIFCRGIKKQ